MQRLHHRSREKVSSARSRLTQEAGRFPEPLPVAQVNPEGAKGRGLYDHWRDLTAPAYELVALDSPERFSADACGYELEDVVAVRSRISGGIFRRDAGRVDRSEEFFWLHQFEYGREVVQSVDETFTMDPGALILRDIRRPSVSHSDAIAQRTLVIPARLLDERLVRDRVQTHRAIARDTPVGRILDSALDDLFEVLPGANAEDARPLRDHIVGLLNGLLGVPGGNTSHQVRRALEAAMRRYLLGRLDDPMVGPDDLCRVFHCSRAKVYRIFEADGGVRQFLRDQRLLRCCDVLTRRDDDPRAIRLVAEHWGFDNPAYFSRAFKQRFGVTPRDARRYALEIAVPAPGQPSSTEVTRQFQAWLRGD